MHKGVSAAVYPPALTIADSLVCHPAYMADEVVMASNPSRVGGLTPVIFISSAANVNLVGLVHVALAERGLPGLSGYRRP